MLDAGLPPPQPFHTAYATGRETPLAAAVADALARS